MTNTITLRKAIERAEESIIVVDGAAYELADVGFEESEMETILEIVSVRNPDSWDKDYGKVSQIAQGIVAGHRISMSLK